MDPVTIGLIAAGLNAALEAYGKIEKANRGLTDEQRAARKQIRKDMVALARQLAADDEDDGA